MAVLEVDTLTVGYSTPVVQNVTFSVEKGQVVGLLGRNGSGKTTILRGLTGSARVSGGTVRVNGTDCLGLKARPRAALMALLSQRIELTEGLRAGEIICMGRCAYGGPFSGPTEQDVDLCRRAAEKLNISHLWDRDCGTLSEGQRQMVQLARVTAQDAAVLLLDEPNSSLDYQNSRLLFEQVQKLTRERDKAALVVMHDPALALRWCDRLLRLENGRLTGELEPAFAQTGEAQSFLSALSPGIMVKRDGPNGTFYCI